MAIYDYDAIHEQNEMNDTDSILDSMLEACESMMDALNESKARRRYLQIQADKQENEDKKKELYNDISKNGPENKKYEYLNKARDAKEASNEIMNKNRKYTVDAMNTGKIRDEIDNEAKISKKYGSSYARRSEENFKKDFGTEDTYQPPKAGKYLEWQKKKRAIKETCLTILSALDDIE